MGFLKRLWGRTKAFCVRIYKMVRARFVRDKHDAAAQEIADIRQIDAIVRKRLRKPQLERLTEFFAGNQKFHRLNTTIKEEQYRPPPGTPLDPQTEAAYMRRYMLARAQVFSYLAASAPPEGYTLEEVELFYAAKMPQVWEDLAFLFMLPDEFAA